MVFAGQDEGVGRGEFLYERAAYGAAVAIDETKRQVRHVHAHRHRAHRDLGGREPEAAEKHDGIAQHLRELLADEASEARPHRQAIRFLNKAHESASTTAVYAISTATLTHSSSSPAPRMTMPREMLTKYMVG